MVQYIPHLAEFFLKVDKYREDKLKFWDKDTFLICIGGDAAPGYDGTSFLVSFLNVGQRVVSSYENLLSFGAGVKEDSKIVCNYVLKLVHDLKELESHSFGIMGKDINFRVEAFPNDMKMMAFLAGELTNSAYYFSTFANVSTDDVRLVDKTFSMTSSCDFKPWSYQRRLKDASLAAKKKTLINAKSAANDETKRHYFTAYMKSIKSRQEFVPLIGQYVDKAMCEPLHLKNNVVKEVFVKLVFVSLLNPLVNCKKYAMIPDDHPFKKLVLFVEKKMCCKMLSSKLILWFNDNVGKKADLKFRFRGQESFAYLKYFPALVLHLKDLLNDSFHHRLMEVFSVSLYIRLQISLSTRIHRITLEDINIMRENGRLLHNSWAKFYNSVSPSMYTLCLIAPEHTSYYFVKFGVGLGINSVEGREQKHQMIVRYKENAPPQDIWSYIFRHEYIHLIYLRLRGFDEKRHLTTASKYLPPVEDGKCSCSLVLVDSHCPICDSKLFMSITI